MRCLTPLDTLSADRVSDAIAFLRLLRRRPLGWVIRESLLGRAAEDLAAAGLLKLTAGHNGIDHVYELERAGD